MKKRGLILLSIFIFGILFFVLSPVNAQEGPTTYFCAERTTSGAWCQNVPFDEVDTNYDYVPTSCDATSFCKTGTCVNAVEGSCRPNVPQRVCQADGGVWDARPRDEISQCQLGCCYIGGSANFVTQTTCTSQAARYGVETSFNPSIRDPLQCAASAFPEDKGACVIDDGFIRTCRILTNNECTSQGVPQGTNIEFHRGFLCTAAALETICGPTDRTTLVEGRDEVFFVDSCGNVANIYDASKINPVVQNYWDRMIEEEDSCVLASDLRNANVCGNCELIDGSIGKKYDRKNSDMFPRAPRYGDFVCADISCKSGKFADEFKARFGRFPDNGERWCGNTAIKSEFENSPGSEYFRIMCSFGETILEPGDPFRQTVCLESEIPIEGQAEGFKIANWRANLWEDCAIQTNKTDCEDVQRRDCVWVEGNTLGLLHVDEGDPPRPLSVNERGELVPREQGKFERFDRRTVPRNIDVDRFYLKPVGAACLPRYPVGLWFWESETERQHQAQQTAGQICMFASQQCLVKLEKSIILEGDWDCVENCECLSNNWKDEMNSMCVVMGDCGVLENYRGIQGYWKINDLYEKKTNYKGE